MNNNNRNQLINLNHKHILLFSVLFSSFCIFTLYGLHGLYYRLSIPNAQDIYLVYPIRNASL